MSSAALADRDLSTTVARWTSRWLIVACGISIFAGIRYYFKQRREEHKRVHDTTRRSTHRGITCTVCEQSPIKGIRYKCVNCNSYDLCEQCEVRAPELHDKTHLFLKIRIPIPPLAIPTGPLLSVLYPGKSLQDMQINPNEVHVLKRLTHFDEVEIEELFEQFKSLASNRSGIDKQTFEQCLGPLGVARNLITDRLFAFFDQDSNGRIDFSELVCGLSVLCKGTPDEKIKYAFRGYDLDGDGYISQEELFKMFKAYFYLSKEAIKDAIKSVEADALGNFDESGTDPVSAAFAQIQSAHNNSANNSNTAVNNNATANNSDANTSNNNNNQSDVDSPVDVPNEAHDDTLTPVTESTEQPLYNNNNTNNNAEQDSESRDHLPGPSAQRASLQKIDLSASVDLTDYFKNTASPRELPDEEPANNSNTNNSNDAPSDMNDVLESMYQQAIEAMATRAFHSADVNKDGKISFEEFKAWAEKDPTMTLWLEALGSIF